MKAIERILNEQLSDSCIAKALRNANGDREDAVDSLVQQCRQELYRSRESQLDNEEQFLRSQLTRMPFADRIAALREREKELQNYADQLGESLDTQSDAINETEQEYTFYAALATGNSEYRDLLRGILHRLIRLRVRQALTPDLVDIYREAAHRVEALRRQAEGDWQVYLQLVNGLRMRVNSRPCDPQALVVEYPPAPKRSVRNLVREILRGYLHRPVGDLSRESPDSLIERIVGDCLSYLPPAPTLAEAVSEQTLRSFLLGLPFTHGVDPGEQPRLEPPLVFIEAPAGLSPLEVNGVQPAVWEQPPNAPLVARVFKFIPLQGIEDLDEWLEADQAMCEKYGGSVLHSAEPHLVEEQNRFLQRIIELVQGGTNDGVHFDKAAVTSVQEGSKPG